MQVGPKLFGLELFFFFWFSLFLFWFQFEMILFNILEEWVFENFGYIRALVGIDPQNNSDEVNLLFFWIKDGIPKRSENKMGFFI